MGESCFDSIIGAADSESSMSRRRVEWKGGLVKSTAQFPPPLPWLARTGNSPSSRVPWIMKRRYTEDGRLVITGEKSERHEYFEAYRSDGRLRLRLVPLDVLLVPADEIADEDERDQGDRTADAALEDRSGLMNGCGSLITDPCGGGGGGVNKCANSFIIGAVAAIPPPVQT
ncbi:unnamed protein product [Cuscuta campestris]|uniref:FAF domain-containing protein n=1 Tax=Cuscuta campestris TaxID=132261 RepID=A0A484LV47_9ASTE|nr:unnamed protein product [Cuscuta campestris]